MSINHFSSDLPETLWWAHHRQYQHHQMEPNPHTPTNTSCSNPATPIHLHHHPSWLRSPMFPPQNPSLNFNLNDEDDEDQDQEPRQEPHRELAEKEPMFEKPLTPSDVGKLNRLVIPKQHAEKYFPLGGVDSAGDKGLLLSFEDESGKCWRFRYSYWNSSQSYVLTKGWSRYVKEKQLDAGDVVLFERHRSDSERLFIGWRRRSQDGGSSSSSGAMMQAAAGSSSTGVWTRTLYPSSSSSSACGHHHHQPSIPSQPDCLHAGGGTQTQSQGGQQQHQQQQQVVGNSKRLRLFGVNLECQLEDSSEPSTPEGGSSLSSQQGPAHHHHQQQQFYSSQ